MGPDALHHFGLGFGIGGAKPGFEIEIVPADDGVLDQAITGFGDLLVLLDGKDELTRTADGHRSGKPVGQLTLLSMASIYPFAVRRHRCSAG